jgi:Fe-S-cluster containining protein
MKFPCNSCGACCRTLPASFELNRGDGVCRHYDDATRLCTVYESRPLVCRIDGYHEARLQGQLDVRIHYAIQAMTCSLLDPANADMPDRTRDALREAGYEDVAVSLDPAQVAETAMQVARTLRPEDFVIPHNEPAPDRPDEPHASH